jgi:hypothetical protein
VWCRDLHEIACGILVFVFTQECEGVGSFRVGTSEFARPVKCKLSMDSVAVGFRKREAGKLRSRSGFCSAIIMNSFKAQG